MARIVLIVVLIINITFISGCSLVRKIAGADIDPEQYLKSREAKISGLKLKATASLLKRLTNGKSVEDADIVFYLSEKLINNLAGQYVGAKGLLDDNTSYLIRGVNVEIDNGIAIASLEAIAHNNEYDVDLALKMDCLLHIKRESENLMISLEPFNITPVVKAGFILSSAEDIISNLVLINVGELSSQFPGIRIPLDFRNKMFIDESSVKVKDKINLVITNPKRIIYYKMNLNEILFFRDKVLVSLDLKDINVY